MLWRNGSRWINGKWDNCYAHLLLGGRGLSCPTGSNVPSMCTRSHGLGTWTNRATDSKPFGYLIAICVDVDGGIANIGMDVITTAGFEVWSAVCSFAPFVLGEGHHRMSPNAYYVATTLRLLAAHRFWNCLLLLFTGIPFRVTHGEHTEHG